MMHNKQAHEFNSWKRDLDRIYVSNIGLGADDLPDREFHAFFEAGYSPAQFWEENRADILAGN